ncbi:MAG: acetyl-CoA carboxylase biotin carboxyl carrier protein [Candidatus Eremiobacteraeota bacterium]|nr:acetyl-CoA carboxylase biotin carboxyl carrier protein [Candidatus Eremiobacteraeota bacterium]MBC5827169.1 acetyl-CoA carboxylase biotin carboxyl carrier protein [Candidatus Eremiobacteraeota bacterium]
MEPYDKIVGKLIELMERDGLDRLHVRVGEVQIDLRMSLPEITPVSPPAVAQAPASGAAAAAPTPVETPANVSKVLAPLIGVFYRAAAPGAAPFVEVGQAVTEGQVLCVLEAMKLMNEIVSERSGTVARVCVKDGELVTLHQELFWIET